MPRKYFLVCLVSSCFWHIFSLENVTQAQIIPDDTLNNENSIVSFPTNSEYDLNQYIEGGAVRENNLFHSFSEFNIPNESQAYFASPSGIDNIITRVTGNNLSNISGKLGIDGGANLFLLNPNGIVFGQNSQLDITGSFLATTADSYIFENNFNYSARNPEIPALLTVDIPVGLQFGTEPGAIINRSRTLPDESILDDDPENYVVPEGLRISAQQNLSLIGGKVILDGGYLNTSEGKIEVGGVQKNNQVKLISQENNWHIDYTDVTSFADIQIEQGGGIDGGNDGGSQIILTGKDISLGSSLDAISELDYEADDFWGFEFLPLLDELPPDKTQIIAHNQNNNIPSQISINASDVFSIIDPGKQSQNIVGHTSGTGDAAEINLVGDSIILYGGSLESWTLEGATGNAGIINFVSQNMSVQYGGGGVNTFSQGNGGTVNLNIAKDVQIHFGGFGADAHGRGNGGKIKIDADNLEIRFGGLGVNTFGEGDGGIIDLNINNNLKVLNGGFGSDTTGIGNGGNIQINTQNLELIAAGMGVNSRGVGKGGEINIKAGTILVKDGIVGAESGQIDLDNRVFDENGRLSTFNARNAGDGGNIFVEANQITIDGGNITTSTVGTGHAGNIQLKADSFEAIGIVDGELLTGINSFTNGSGSGGEITIYSHDFKLSDGATVAANSINTGQAGNIDISSTNHLELIRGGTISVDGGIDGLPGNINIQGKDIFLNQQGEILANTTQGTQGNITIAGDNLLLRDRSQIITNGSQTATGGNISMDIQKNLLGFNNSQITANAERGQGGNIDINTKRLFFSADSQINARSQFGIDGLIEIDTFSIDPHFGLIQLPTDPIDPSLYLSQGCSRQQQNEFISVGRGGLPKNPLNNLAQDTFILDWGDINVTSQSTPDLDSLTSVNNKIDSIVEAQSWKINQQGKVELTATLDKSNVSQGSKQISCLK